MSLVYRSDGPTDAPALVLSNSLGTTWDLWEPQLPTLATHYRVVRYDHPGHGRSEQPPSGVTVEALAEGVVALLDDLELGRVTFCGLSLGGMVGMALAQTAPERVERLVFCCTAAYVGPPEQWHDRARLVREGGTAAVAERVVERWFTESFRAEHPAATARFRALLEQIPREGYARCCEAIAAWDARSNLGTIHAPTLVVAGADDVATPPEDAAFLAESIPTAELTVLPDAAHLANVEQSERFNEVLLAFLSATSPGEAAA